MNSRPLAKRLARNLTALLIALALPASAPAADAAFNIYYSGEEDLVLSRLLLDPTTHRTTTLADAATAVYQDNLPPTGPQLDALKARVNSGMGVVLILGRHTDAAALESLTGGAVKQTGVDVAHGTTHDIELERLAAVINYVGPPADPLARNISWLSAVRVHERTQLEVTGGEVIVRTNPRDPVRPKTPILLRVHSGRGTIYILNVWLRQGDQSDRVASLLTMLKGIECAENYDFQRWPFRMATGSRRRCPTRRRREFWPRSFSRCSRFSSSPTYSCVATACVIRNCSKDSIGPRRRRWRVRRRSARQPRHSPPARRNPRPIAAIRAGKSSAFIARSAVSSTTT
jgi:hypothetical protein